MIGRGHLRYLGEVNDDEDGDDEDADDDGGDAHVESVPSEPP